MYVNGSVNLMALLGSSKLSHYGTVLRRLIRPTVCTSSCGKHTEPDYLDTLKPQKPIYDVLNICAKSYDFSVIEQYGRYLHRTANRLGLNVTDAWATPARLYDISTFKPTSTKVDQKYKLYHYERNVQISEFPCFLMPIYVSLIRASLPEGVELSIHKHEEEHEEIRYIPDTDLNILKDQLIEMSHPSQKGKKK
ncbi:39S ribosomal protein L48, mitochondrial [Chamberlinius hualienensis]